MCVCVYASVCSQFSVLIVRWRLFQSASFQYNQFKMLDCMTASQEVERTWLQVLACAVLRKPIVIFVCFSVCLGMLITNKLYE